ncbi:MAG: hypothetical protein MI861_04580 [Pirellulales bacterium]|nr:hypothetical protein [Pirellulales bacterium]
MLGILIDAFVLIVLIKAINDDDAGLGMAVVISLVAAIGTGILAITLSSAFGLTGTVAAGVAGAALVGVAVSMLFGIEIKRAMLIGLIFMLVHFGNGFLFSYLLS